MPIGPYCGTLDNDIAHLVTTFRGLCMNRINMFKFFGLILIATQLQAQHSDSVYYQEFKALKQSPFYRTIFDRKANYFLKSIDRSAFNSQELNLINKLLRGDLIWLQSALVLTAESSPKLYGYVDAVCKQQHIQTPTLFISGNKNKQLYITSIGKDVETDSRKIFWSSGAIILSQDLLTETSEKALEAALAYEIAHIKYNHQNKNMVINWVSPAIVQIFAKRVFEGTGSTLGDAALINIAAFLLPRVLMGKQFEKEADKFVCQTMNNAQGLIEFCQYLQQKEARYEANYRDTYKLLRTSNISLLMYLWNGIPYHIVHTGHKINNVIKWLCQHTFLTEYQTIDARIKNAQRYLDQQEN